MKATNGSMRFTSARTNGSDQKPTDNRQATARELGFRERGVAERGKVVRQPALKTQHIQDEYERKQQIEFPEHASPTPELRAERVAEQAAEAPERITEKRMQSVSVGREAVKQETEPYLREQYTNPDGEMFCQVCKAPLPFKLADGNYYFEMVEFLREPDLQKRHYQNYLVLCPNHAAMYKHANGSERR